MDAKAKLDAVVRKLDDRFLKASAYQDADAGLTAATADLKFSRDAVMAKLANSDDYKQALQDRDDAKTALQSSGGDSGDFATAQAKYLAAMAQVGKLELAACTADPTTSAAMAAYDQARKAVLAQTTKFQDSLKHDPEWLAAKTDVDNAEANLKALLLAAKSPQTAAK